MRRFIALHPMAFLVAVLGGVVVATGLGSLILAAGVPVTLLLYIQLGSYLVLPFAILLAVREREGGAVAVALSAALPVLTFFAWLEHQLAGNLGAAFGLMAIGVSLIYAGIYWLGPRDVPVSERPAKPSSKAQVSAGHGSLVKHGA